MAHHWWWGGGIAAVLLLVVPAEGGDAWQRVGAGLRESPVLAVTVDPAEPRRLYVGTTRRVYGSTDEGAHWRTLLSLRGTATAVHAITIAAHRPQQLWAATDDGLWSSDDRGGHWQRRYRGLGPVQRQVLAVTITSTRLFAGTQHGLLTSDDAGRTWRPDASAIQSLAITAIAVSPLHPHLVLLGTSGGLFRSLDGGLHWEHVVVLSAEAADETVDDGHTTEEDAPPPAPAFTSLLVDPHAPATWYAGSIAGVYRSADEGNTWRPMTRVGLASTTVQDVLLAPTLLAATSAGLFRYVEQAGPATGGAGRWEALREGFASTKIHRLAAAADGSRLYATTEDGVFRSEAASAWRLGPDPTHRFDQEPSIRDLQAVAIRYAEVSPEKIARWRTLAARRAWLPTVSLSYDQDYSISDRTDEGTFPAYHVTDDKDLDQGWDVSVSWNLGDLIWNDDQTSIDVRSRLTAELRDDVLDEVNRLYFERRRLQLELALSPPPTRQEALERDLRLQELTAGLDALTGGYLSSHLTP